MTKNGWSSFTLRVAPGKDIILPDLKSLTFGLPKSGFSSFPSIFSGYGLRPWIMIIQVLHCLMLVGTKAQGKAALSLISFVFVPHILFCLNQLWPILLVIKEPQSVSQDIMAVIDWIMFLQNQYVEALTPNFTVFGDRSDKEVEPYLRLNES